MQVFPCEFSHIFNNTFLTKHLFFSGRFQFDHPRNEISCKWVYLIAGIM